MLSQSDMKHFNFHCFHLHLQGEQGDDGKVEGPPGPQGDIVSNSLFLALFDKKKIKKLSSWY